MKKLFYVLAALAMISTAHARGGAGSSGGGGNGGGTIEGEGASVYVCPDGSTVPLLPNEQDSEALCADEE